MTISAPSSIIRDKQSASSTLTIAANVNQASSTIVFPHPFLATPTVHITPATIINKNAQVIAFLPFCFLCTTSAGQVWTNMPAAQTEIFGDINHRVFENPQGGFLATSTAFFTVFCITPSASATAFLQAQFSTDAGATWTSFNDGTVDIGIAGPCGFAPTYLQGTIPSFPVFAFNQGFYMRVVGQNGNGIGDVPQFNMIQIAIEFQEPLLVTVVATATAVTPTQFVLTIRDDIAVATPTSMAIVWDGEVA